MRKHLDKNKNILRLNVGFLLKEGIGYSREFQFDAVEAQMADDFSVGRLSGAVTLTRTPQGLYAQGRLEAHTREQCVLCLTEVDQIVTSQIAELYIYPPENAPADALTVGDDAHLDLAPLIREDMLVSKPIRILCRPDCKGLCPNCGQNWNDGPCNCQEDTTDPRWAALAKLKKELSRHTDQ